MTEPSTVDSRRQSASLAARARMAQLTTGQRHELAAKGAAAGAGLAGRARMAQLTAEERRELGAKGGRATARKRTAEQRREHMRKASGTYWGSMTPEQRSEAMKARVRARSPDLQRKIARKAVETRWARAAYTANPQPADQLYAFLESYISVKRYAPTVREMSRALHHGEPQIGKMLRILERIGCIERHPWERGIVLNAPSGETVPTVTREAQEPPCLAPAIFAPATVERAIDWKVIRRAFEGVKVNRITAAAIARHFRQRTAEVGQEMAEREANVLLALRFPEVFLERRARLDSLPEFLDIPRAKRGCRSCGRAFHKLRPNQRYCSARCRAREKRRRRDATAHGKMLKAQQNARYRERYADKERERRRQWKANNRDKLKAQREREHTRRSLNSPWNEKLSWKLPPAIAALRIANSGKET